ncbi:hypothetical protein AGOR_G00231590 [Albula goreensis]|uniref:Uncharacterized protein n=1 Tax=Albula goreensis TaxID=1534307 RepID=A0A8T3CJ31_9TELE|nr:hypothetical protein AGOR_G00231590 [Albula goreensis]
MEEETRSLALPQRAGTASDDVEAFPPDEPKALALLIHSAEGTCSSPRARGVKPTTCEVRFRLYPQPAKTRRTQVTHAILVRECRSLRR